jgi:hypothetical protein
MLPEEAKGPSPASAGCRAIGGRRTHSRSYEKVSDAKCEDPMRDLYKIRGTNNEDAPGLQSVRTGLINPRNDVRLHTRPATKAGLVLYPDAVALYMMPVLGDSQDELEPAVSSEDSFPMRSHWSRYPSKASSPSLHSVAFYAKTGVD